MVKKRAALLLPVFENNVKYGTSGSKSARGPVQKSMVMTTTTAMAEFATYDHHITCGTTMDASLTSSATASGQYCFAIERGLLSTYKYAQRCLSPTWTR